MAHLADAEGLCPGNEAFPSLHSNRLLLRFLLLVLLLGLLVVRDLQLNAGQNGRLYLVLGPPSWPRKGIYGPVVVVEPWYQRKRLVLLEDIGLGPASPSSGVDVAEDPGVRARQSMGGHELLGNEQAVLADVLHDAGVAALLAVLREDEDADVRLLDEDLVLLRHQVEVLQQLQYGHPVADALQLVQASFELVKVVLHLRNEGILIQLRFCASGLHCVADLQPGNAFVHCFRQCVLHPWLWAIDGASIHSDRLLRRQRLQQLQPFVVHFEAPVFRHVCCLLLVLEAAVEAVAVGLEGDVELLLQQHLELHVLACPVVGGEEEALEVAGNVDLVDDGLLLVLVGNELPPFDIDGDFLQSGDGIVNSEWALRLLSEVVPRLCGRPQLQAFQLVGLEQCLHVLDVGGAALGDVEAVLEVANGVQLVELLALVAHDAGQHDVVEAQEDRLVRLQLLHDELHLQPPQFWHPLLAVSWFNPGTVLLWDVQRPIEAPCWRTPSPLSSC